jgi:tetratricopeptide (TPR) repeat protein
MFHSLLRCTLLILIFTALSWGQTATGDNKPAPPGSSSTLPSSATPGGSQLSAPAAGSEPPHSPLFEAIRHFRRGEFDAAIQNYNLVLQNNPQSPDAYAGLARVYLKQKNVEKAYEAATSGLKAADTPAVRVALGEVYFRQGKIPEAEQEWANVINKGYPSARAYLGISRVRTALSLYAQAKTMLDKAHELDPTDPDIQKRWISSLSRAEQIQFWENYLASPTNDDAETRAAMQHHLDYLKAMQNQPRHACRLVSQFPSTETNLLRMMIDPVHLRGYGLPVEVNGKKGKLLFDTGASGILIDSDLARKANISQVSETDIGGIGDKGRAGGYVGFANSLKIGDLEFQDCRVQVIEKRSVLDEDGLIGGDVFSRFLVDIDFPKEKLRLSPLPKRPDDTDSDEALQASTEGSGTSADPASGKAPSETVAKASPAAQRGPRDRYIAPEMRSYTQVYRFGHNLVIPTRIGDSPPRLFVLDTGSQRNLMSLKTAEEYTKVHNDSRMQVRGLSGSVAKVYSADKVLLEFGRLRQENQNVISFDLSHMSDNLGTEVSGILGFATLGLLDIDIDYRDGLVDFAYNGRP